MLESLEQIPEVEYARIICVRQPFASYRKHSLSSEIPNVFPEGGTQFVEGGLDVVQPIIIDGQVLGTIYLHANLNEIHDQTIRYIIIVSVMIVISLVLSTFVCITFSTFHFDTVA